MDVEAVKNRGYGRGGGGYGREVGNGEDFAPPAGPGKTRAFRTVWLVIACMAFPMLAFASGMYKPPLLLIAGAYQGSSHQERKPPQPLQRSQPAVHNDAVHYGPSDEPREKYLGSLLADGFDEDTCQSRYQSTMYRKPSPYKPSPHLVQRLREYEERHRLCAPGTSAYNRTLPFLSDVRPAPERDTDCKYVLWSPWSGLGNRILSLASAFLYALLTDRVLLIDRGKDMTSLFCEPFPDTTWLLPLDFPITEFNVFGEWHPLSYGNLLRSKNISTDGTSGRPPPSFVYLHLPHYYHTVDMHFFCEPDQAVLRRVPWLLFNTNNYLVPAFFLNQEFEPELSRLFPEKETVFHHLGRYLFHPTNEVWGMVTRYYRSYMAMARERLGIQIRVFKEKDAPFEVVSEQIINCTLKEGLLPHVDTTSLSSGATAADPTKTKAVLITSLYSGYFDKIRDMYWEHPAVGGVTVSVHQPTHEEKQQTDKLGHDLKAWAEMILLSFADVLVTSAQSTFGYVGQGLGGIRPWVLTKPEKAAMPEPTCMREISMEPCFHSPTTYICRENKSGDNGKVVPFVSHCSDVSRGLKLVDRTE